MPLDSTQQKHSPETPVRSWAAIVQQPKRVLNAPGRDINDSELLRNHPVSGEISQIKNVEFRPKFNSKLQSEITGADTVHAQNSRLGNLAAKSSPGRQGHKVTANTSIPVNDRESRRRERRHAPQTLDETSKRTITDSGAWLTDLHMSQFAYLLKSCTQYSPRETWRIQMPSTIEPVCPTDKHIQILHSAEQHWVCAYYDSQSIFIYDSFNSKRLYRTHETYLRKLFPFYQFDSKPIKFPTVQNQPNLSDCGVFAIAFAISLVNGKRPDKIMYDVSLMRAHLLKLFENNVIEEFPHVRKTRGMVTKINNFCPERKRKVFSESVQDSNSEQIEIENSRLAGVKKNELSALRTQNKKKLCIQNQNPKRMLPII